MIQWDVRLTEPAKKDYAKILAYTKRNFGEQQRLLYRQLLLDTLKLLTTGPDAPGSISRQAIMDGLRTLHCARRGRNASHMIVYRQSGSHCIDVLRILHDKMDLPRHLSNDG